MVVPVAIVNTIARAASGNLKSKEDFKELGKSIVQVTGGISLGTTAVVAFVPLAISSGLLEGAKTFIYAGTGKKIGDLTPKKMSGTKGLLENPLKNTLEDVKDILRTANDFMQSGFEPLI